LSFPKVFIGNLIFLIYINRGWLVPACPELVSGTRSGNSLLRWRLQLWLIVQKGSNNIKHKHTLKKQRYPPSRAHVVRLYVRHVPRAGAGPYIIAAPLPREAMFPFSKLCLNPRRGNAVMRYSLSLTSLLSTYPAARAD
jgi:hypothetical protein